MTVAWIALGLSLASLFWQVFVWRRGRKFDVRVRAQVEWIAAGSGELEVEIFVENHGSTFEAVQEVWLLYDDNDVVDEPDYIQPNIDRPELPPRRNFRHAVDILDSVVSSTPQEVRACARLETGHVVGPSQAIEITEENIRVARGG